MTRPARAAILRALGELLTTEQVARLVGVSSRAIQMHRQRGTIPEPDAHVGRTPVWFRTSIDRWLAGRRK